jgi:hypothetical protein
MKANQLKARPLKICLLVQILGDIVTTSVIGLLITYSVETKNITMSILLCATRVLTNLRINRFCVHFIGMSSNGQIPDKYDFR